MTVHQLAAYIRKHSFLISNLVGMALDSLVFEGESALLNSGQLTVEQIESYQAQLRELPEPPSAAEVIDVWERIAILDTIIIFSRSVAAGDGVLEEMDQVKVPPLIDINHLLRNANQTCDEIVQALKMVPYTNRVVACEEFEERLIPEFDNPVKMTVFGYFSRDYATEVYGDTLMGLLFPAITQADKAWGRSSSRRQLLLIGLELEKYRLQNGSFPESLNPLKDRLPAETFIDYFTDASLVYRPSATGYMIYSIGDNLRDDDGKSFDNPPDPKDPFNRTDDMVLKVNLNPEPARAERPSDELQE
ncbi:MAG: hypothetical protein R3C11_04220 [Planctomycetaceae bacterium]